MPTFVHTGDVHLDTPFSANFSQKQMQIRRREVMQTFRSIVLAAKDKDFLLISGDLFDGQFVSADTISFVKRCFAEIPDTQILMVAGNHDPYLPDSVYATEFWGDNVHIFGTEWEFFDFPEKKTRVHGRSFRAPHEEISLMKEISLADGWCNLMLLHGEIVAVGGESSYNPIEKNALARCGVDYVALGHIHQRSSLARLDGVYYAYCGIPEGRGFDEEGEKGYYIGEANKGYVELNWIPSSSRVFRYVIIDVTSAENGFEVQEMIADAIKNAEGADGIYKVLLRGRTRRGMVDIANLSDALSHVAFYLDIVDETKPEILPEEMAKENTLRGDFAKAMLEKIQEMPDEEKEIGYLALELGLSSMERGHRA